MSIKHSDEQETLAAQLAACDEHDEPIDLSPPGYLEIANAVFHMKEVSERIFGGPVTMEEEWDPEIAGERYIVVSVKDSGTVKEFKGRCSQWHRSLIELPPKVRGLFRLSF